MTVRKNFRVFSLCVFIAALIIARVAPIDAQESFGFGDESAADESATSTGAPWDGVTVGGKLVYEPTFFFDADNDPILDSTIARINIEASGSSVDAVVKLEFSQKTLSTYPEDVLDEAYVRAFYGLLTLEGGWLKVFWGKADSQGPLDVLNPFDLTDLTVTETRDRKIAQPMLLVSWAIGDMTKIEGAFIPGFKQNRIQWAGLWEPSALAEQKTLISKYAAQYVAAGYAVADIDLSSESDVLDYPDTERLKYAQGGLRFTTTFGVADFGLQVFYGYLPNPAISADSESLAALIASGTPMDIVYNRYGQLGSDFAIVLAGFNLRSELAADITEDLYGDDPDVYNPALLWSLGFDRDLFSGVNLNLQGSGAYRLWNDRVGDEDYDIEEGLHTTKTTVTAIISQKLLNDTVKWEVKGLFGVEDPDYLIVPKLTLAIGDAEASVSAGFFGGDDDGDFGQYGDNSFVRISLAYEF